MSLPYPIIAVDSSKQGVHGSYINEKGHCETITFPDDYYKMGSKYTTDGDMIRENIEVDIATASVSTFGVLRFVIKICNLLNPFCDCDEYSSGGMIKYGENLYLLCENPVKGKVKAYNFTFENMCDLDIIDKGFYIHPNVSKVYLTLWNMFSSTDYGNFKKHPISQYNFSTTSVLKFLGGRDSNIDYLTVVSIIDSLDPDTKVKAKMAVEMFTNGNTDEAIEYISQCGEDDDIAPTIKDAFKRLRDILNNFDLSDSKRHVPVKSKTSKEESDIIPKDYVPPIQQKRPSSTNLQNANKRQKQVFTDEPVQGFQRQQQVIKENLLPMTQQFPDFQQEEEQQQQTLALL